MKRKAISLLFPALLLCAALFFIRNRAADSASESWNGTTYENISYSAISEADYLNLYLPDSDQKLPLLILVHGGGFFSNDCTSRQARYMYEYFRSHGYACASINYRLSQEAPYPAAVSDVKAAIRFLRAHADEYGIDENRFAIWGESAGAYLAVMAALSDDNAFSDVAFPREETWPEPVSARVNVLIDFYGPMEFYEMDADFTALHIPVWLRKLTGVSSDGTTAAADSPESLWLNRAVGALSEEEKDTVSPYPYLQKNLPSLSDLYVYIRHGGMDITVPSLQSQKLYEKISGLLGTSQVNYKQNKWYKHADDLFYTDKNLSELKQFLEEALR